MVQGLAILLRTTPSITTTVIASVPAENVLPADDAFVRLFANIVLRTHTELLHVY
jgi:hypothetical protein